MKQNSRLVPLFSVVFVDMLGFGLILPLLPYIAANWGATPAMIGLIGAAYPLGQFLGAPVIGRFSDRFGRKPLLLISIAGTFLSLLMLGFARSIAVIMLSRFLDGITGGNITVAQAYIADVTDEKSRAKGMGMIGAAFGLGFILGPASGGLLSQWGYAVPAFVSAGLSLVNLFLISVLLHESLPKEKRVHHLSEAKRRHPLIGLGAAFAKPIAGPILSSIIVFSLSMAMFESVFSLFAKQRLALTAQNTGLILAYVGVLVAGIQGGGMGVLTKRFPENVLVRFALITLTLSYIGWALSPNVAVLMIVLVPLSLSSGILSTLLRSGLSKAVPPNETGEIMGISAAMESITRIVAPALGGWLIGSLSSIAPGLLCAVLLGGLTVYLIALQKKHRLPEHIGEADISDIGIDVFGRSCFLSDPGCSRNESAESESSSSEDK
jgi:DHA1 family tetracycline resistance protein-like MFS transporter